MALTVRHGRVADASRPEAEWRLSDPTAAERTPLGGLALRTLSMVTTKTIPAKGTEWPASTSVAERVDQKGEGCRGLAVARVVEVIARERRAPVGQHPDEPPLG